MKKLLISILVLAMTIPASASYTVGVTPNDVEYVYWDITVWSDGTDPDEYWVLAIEPGGTLSNVTIGPDAPSLSANWGTIAYNGLSGYLPGLTGYVGPFATAAGETKQSGTYLTALVTVGYGWPYLYLYSFDGDLNFTDEDANLIPEPSAFCVLGLGALALLRRRNN